VWLETTHQRCWFQKAGNVLFALPKTQHPSAKRMLTYIRDAATLADGNLPIKCFTTEFAMKWPMSANAAMPTGKHAPWPLKSEGSVALDGKGSAVIDAHRIAGAAKNSSARSQLRLRVQLLQKIENASSSFTAHPSIAPDTSDPTKDTGHDGARQTCSKRVPTGERRYCGSSLLGFRRKLAFSAQEFPSSQGPPGCGAPRLR
jgi:hypothetical protein